MIPKEAVVRAGTWSRVEEGSLEGPHILAPLLPQLSHWLLGVNVKKGASLPVK